MKNERLAGAVIWAVILALSIWAVAYAMTALIETAVKVAIALIPPLLSIAGAVLTQAYQRAREFDIEHLKRKQNSYADIISLLSAYVRDPKKKNDEFATVFLRSWILCEDEVALAIYRFMNERSADRLDAVIRSMRNDIGLHGDIVGHDESWKSIKVTSAGLFPPPPPKEEGSL